MRERTSEGRGLVSNEKPGLVVCTAFVSFFRELRGEGRGGKESE